VGLLDSVEGGQYSVKTIDDYLRHAAECRDMARSASPTHRHQLEQMAEVWEQLAEAHRHELENHGKSSVDDDATEIE
jgi:hypothetical protein